MADYYDDDYRWGWRRYVSSADRRRNAEQEKKRLAKKGHIVAPVIIEGRNIANTFWGKAWCENLERYSDFSNRLPRGRTYVRNGSVLDLHISAGSVSAKVCGTDVYDVEVNVAPVTKTSWSAICRDCAGGIDSLVELLQGKLSNAVMARICRQKTGLFPSPAEIKFECSCPDWASMCKHVAAVLYGIGARLDKSPELLFTLRQVDAQELIAGAGTSVPIAGAGPSKAKRLKSEDLSELFGIDIAELPDPPKRKPRKKK